MDIATFRKYYELYYDQLCHFLNFYTQDITIIEDVLQEVYLKLWENRDEIEIQYIKTYLFHAAKNRVLNHLRDEQNRHYLLENWFNQQQQEKQGKECYDLEQFTTLLYKAIEQLPEKCREIFLLSRQEKLTYKQIAEKLDISVKTVEAQMGIALKRIRDTLSTASFSFLLWLIQ
ncbi:RNA polymerase sigma-70 factor [uncultured Bacteroides sp.]|uniref:RNA polymerase sigma-70 factor n=1 Tax=uncultured Bacteroides sp. TaxID=162156 RepID=UPI0025E3460A|nr:RNA polymerase sigma-70 factor [uncultured Bacteroides sp.]